LTNITLQIRIYFNQNHYDYSIQVLDPEPLYRWDNKEHFPDLKTYPHHFHAKSHDITDSSLTGKPLLDLQIILNELKKLLKK
jgi:hypothetical protein